MLPPTCVCITLNIYGGGKWQAALTNLFHFPSLWQWESNEGWIVLAFFIFQSHRITQELVKKILYVLYTYNFAFCRRNLSEKKLLIQLFLIDFGLTIWIICSLAPHPHRCCSTVFYDRYFDKFKSRQRVFMARINERMTQANENRTYEKKKTEQKWL